MKILYDYQIFRSQRYGGISRYHYELIRGLRRKHSIQVPVIGSVNHYLSLLTGKKVKTITSSAFMNKVYEGLNRIETYLYVKLWRPDIVHLTYYNPYILSWLPEKTRLVITAHDIIHERYADDIPADDKTSRNKRLVCDAADRIIAISENTKEDFINVFGLPEEKITVIYHGNPFESSQEEHDRQPDPIVDHDELPYPYLLFVGQRDWYKNFIPTLTALAAYLNEQDLHLVCVGGPPFTDQELALFDTCGITHLVHREEIDDEKLRRLYAGAQVFLYPSLYEGFGIPILEAWSCECPVLLQDNTCFREVAQDGALFFDTEQPETVVAAVDLIRQDPDAREALITKGNRLLTGYSFNATVDKTEELYRELIHEQNR
ncbi:MAG: glycosyltransferase family 4 protein [Spirochaetia bacterium]|nr:glycosyltransferase family 4 protein [Spirochaetia bacterium]MCF7941086.1 glycosyltransferase family 4 protein [Spirochaetia bacterium]